MNQLTDILDQDLDPAETAEWTEALKGVINADGTDRAHFLLERMVDETRRAGRVPAVRSDHRIRQHDPAASRSAHARRSDDGVAHPLADPLERDGDGRAREPQARRARRAHRELRVVGDALRRRLQTISGARRATSIRAISCSIRAIRARASTRVRISKAASTSTSSISSRMEVAGKGRGLSSYPHPWLMPDYWQVPTVSMGLGPAAGDLSGALLEISRKPRAHSAERSQGLVLHRRRRIRRARDARCDLARGPRRAR